LCTLLNTDPGADITDAIVKAVFEQKSKDANTLAANRMTRARALRHKTTGWCKPCYIIKLTSTPCANITNIAHPAYIHSTQGHWEKIVLITAAKSDYDNG
jgi:hypothetical protein